MSIVRKISRWSSAVLLLAVGALWSASLYAASGLPAGTFVLDAANETQSFGTASETVTSAGKNSRRCQLNQDSLAIMKYLPAGIVSRGDQRGAFGNKSQGQDCAFIGADQFVQFVPVEGPGSVIPGGATISGWEMEFILTDDAIFKITPLLSDGTPVGLEDTAGASLSVESFIVYSGKRACFPEGTSGDARPREGAYVFNHVPCTAQSNPNSDFSLTIGQRAGGINTFDGQADFLGEVGFPKLGVVVGEGWRQTKIDVLAGSVGIAGAEFDFELVPDGSLTCEEDSSGIGAGATTTTGTFEIFEIGDGVQCRRLPNRPGTGQDLTCEAVPFVLNTSCNADGSDCDIEFLHGDQQTTLIDRGQYAFVCEVWWPPRVAKFTSGGVQDEPVLNRTQVSWGGLTTPEEPGDEPVRFCPGVSPVFSDMQSDEPDWTTDCGTGLEYKLSVPATPGPVVDGLTVSPNTSGCSLLEAYDDVLVPYPGAEGDPGDQCNSATCTQPFRQLACQLQERLVLVEDILGATGNRNANGRYETNDTTKPPSAPMLRKGEVIFIEGDVRLRSVR